MGLADYQRVPLLFGPLPVHRLERFTGLACPVRAPRRAAGAQRIRRRPLVSDTLSVSDTLRYTVLNCSNGWRQLSHQRIERQGVGPKMFSSRVSVEPQ
jgi:hypothetical protein